MSLITRCPACSTMFKVVPDQLRISEGWVRCGQCDEVFDANAHLQTQEQRPQVTPIPSDIAPTQPAPDISHAQPAQSIDLEGHVAVDEVEVAEHVQDTIGASLDHRLDPFLEKSPQELSLYLGIAPGALLDGGALDDAPASQGADELPASSGSAATPRFVQSGSSLRPDPANAALSFMHSAERPSVWRRPLVRVTLSVGSVLLGGLLVLQVLVQERDRIAAMAPGARSILEVVCGVLSCQIEPLRQIEAVVIDSSSFTKIRADIYRLNLTVKNTAQTEVAAPAVELTLTDMQDQSVVRRVFSAAELGGKNSAMPPGSELTASLPISIKMPTGAERISGYRLLAFYP